MDNQRAMDPATVINYIQVIQDGLYILEHAFRDNNPAKVAMIHHSTTDNMNSLAMLLSIQVPQAGKYSKRQVHMATEYMDELIRGGDKDKLDSLISEVADTDLLGAVMDMRTEWEDGKREMEEGNGEDG